MLALESGINWVEIIVGIMAAMVLGDYLGHKFGRMKIAIVSGSIALLSIVCFAVFAAVELA
jgi:hypothetical protein